MIKFSQKLDITLTNKIEIKYSKVARFFGLKTPPIAKVHTFNTRKDFNTQIGRKTEDWLVAYADKNNIYILSPGAFERESSHKKTEFEKILVHELCHVITHTVNPEIPLWIDEGIALNFAGQKKKKSFNSEDISTFFKKIVINNIDLQTFSKYKGYEISYWILRNILKPID